MFKEGNEAKPSTSGYHVTMSMDRHDRGDWGGRYSRARLGRVVDFESLEALGRNVDSASLYELFDVIHGSDANLEG